VEAVGSLNRCGARLKGGREQTGGIGSTSRDHRRQAAENGRKHGHLPFARRSYGYLDVLIVGTVFLSARDIEAARPMEFARPGR